MHGFIQKTKNMLVVVDNTNNFEIDKYAIYTNALIKTMAKNIQECSHFTHTYLIGMNNLF